MKKPRPNPATHGSLPQPFSISLAPDEVPEPTDDSNARVASSRTAPRVVVELFVVYLNPSDYPGKVVVRRWVVSPRKSVSPDREPVAVVDTVSDARDAIPRRGLVRIPRSPSDDPVIYETWT